MKPKEELGFFSKRSPQIKNKGIQQVRQSESTGVLSNSERDAAGIQKQEGKALQKTPNSNKIKMMISTVVNTPVGAYPH